MKGVLSYFWQELSVISSAGNCRWWIVDRCSSYFRLRCIVWDLSRSFLLRLAISIFTVILIYTMAQVNTFTCSVDSCNDNAREKCESIGNCHRWVPFPELFSNHFVYFRALENEEYCPKCSRILNERFVSFNMDAVNDIIPLCIKNYIWWHFEQFSMSV